MKIKTLILIALIFTGINSFAQEKKVLQLLVAGKSYKMIAAELFVAFDTVKSHITNIYAKLHVHSGTEAVSLAIRDKIV